MGLNEENAGMMPVTQRGWEQAQMSVIGSMLIDDRCIGDVMRITTAEMFANSTYRNIYEAIRRLWTEQRPVDPVIVLDELGGNRDLYADKLTECLKLTPTAANVLEYSEILRDHLLLHSYQTAASEIIFQCGTAEEAAKVWDELGRQLMGARKVRCMSLQEAIGDYLDRMNDQTPPDYLSTGIKQLDKLLNLGHGKFCILAADSSAGKTAMALQFAFHMASCGKKVGFFSLETDNRTLTDRLMAEAQVANIALPRTKAKALSREDYLRATDAGDRSTRLRLDLIDSCETIDEIRTWTVMKGYEVIFIDYLQLIDAEGEKRWDIVTRISMELHRLAQKLGVTVVGLSQVTPPDKTGNQKLTMDDLRESRQLKHDADVILLLELCKEFPNGRALTIAKNKDGKRNRGMKLDFDPEHMTFRYHKRVATSADPPQFEELADDEGGEIPF